MMSRLQKTPRVSCVWSKYRYYNAVGLYFYHLAGAAAATYDVLGPRHVAATQKQGAFVPPCLTFSSRSPPKAEAEQEAMDCYEPSQHDNLAIAFSSAFNGLSLRDNHPRSSATAIEASSSYTGNVFLCSACSGSPLF
jgi:hypothetical protein